MATYLIFGATGQVGSVVVHNLIQQGHAVKAVSRDPSKEEAQPGLTWIAADLSQPTSLDGIFHGVDAVFLNTNATPRMPELQGNAVQAAAQQGVPFFVKMSALGASDHTKSPIAAWHYQVEQTLKASGMPWALLRPHVFMQNFLGYADEIRTHSRFSTASGYGRIPFIDTRDISDSAAALLQQPDRASQTHVLTGPEAISYGDVATILSELLGRTITYDAAEPEAVKANMEAAGQASYNIQGMLALAKYQRQEGATARTSSSVQELTGHAPRSFRGLLQEQIERFR